jgi:hypothetical protein
MADNELRYDRMVEDALRSVVSRALVHIAERGLSGDHHFYITFLTDHPGVEMPDHLRSHYPNEMTIVLQHQFWGLEVGPEAFGVTLSFANEHERLTVPFAAVTAFADPSVRFGLQFDVSTGALKPGEDEQVLRADLPPPELEAANIMPLTQKRGPGAEAGAEVGAEAGAEAERGQSPPDSDSDKVVTLDAFRKIDDQGKT